MHFTLFGSGRFFQSPQLHYCWERERHIPNSHHRFLVYFRTMANRLQRKLWLFAVGLLVCSSTNGKVEAVATGNVSFIGVAVSAMCYCKQRTDFQLCSSWHVKDNTSTFYDKASEITSLQTRELRVYNNFVKHSLCSTSVLGHKQGSRNSCATYLQTTNQLYKDSLIEHYSAWQNQSMDWSQCNYMCTSNVVGCNYTITVVSKNDSEGSHPFIGDSLHYFASSFGSVSRHMQLGKLYRVSVYKYKRATDKVEISKVNHTPPSSEPQRDVFIVSMKKPTQPQKWTDGAKTTDGQDPILRVRTASSTVRMVVPMKNLLILTLSSILVDCFVN